MTESRLLRRSRMLARDGSARICVRETRRARVRPALSSTATQPGSSAVGSANAGFATLAIPATDFESPLS